MLGETGFAVNAVGALSAVQTPRTQGGLLMSQYKAPTVVYPVGRSQWAAGMMVLGWAAAAGVTLAWTWASGPGDHAPVWGWASLLLAGLALLWHWRSAPSGQLAWDGHSWLWVSRAYPVGTPLSAPEVVIDLQRVIVVRMSNPADAALTLWLEARQEPRHWLDLRRAIYARPQGADTNAAQALGAGPS